MSDLLIPCAIFGSAWFCNLWDLINGTHFYPSIDVLIYANFMGLLGFILIIMHYKEKGKKKK